MIIEYVCIVCGKHVRKKRSPANVKTIPKFCSQKCNGLFRKAKGNGIKPNTEYTCVVCGKRVKTYRSPSSAQQYTPKYCSVKCTGIGQKGVNNPAYAGGEVMLNTGYIAVLNPDHPNADDRGYILKHRLIMETMIGRLLELEEVVHHENGDRQDNSPENLILFKNQSEHMRYHNEEWRKCNESD